MTDFLTIRSDAVGIVRVVVVDITGRVDITRIVRVTRVRVADGDHIADNLFIFTEYLYNVRCLTFSTRGSRLAR